MLREVVLPKSTGLLREVTGLDNAIRAFKDTGELTHLMFNRFIENAFPDYQIEIIVRPKDDKMSPIEKEAYEMLVEHWNKTLVEILFNKLNVDPDEVTVSSDIDQTRMEMLIAQLTQEREEFIDEDLKDLRLKPLDGNSDDDGFTGFDDLGDLGDLDLDDF
jgi:hypothetical protein